MTFEYEVSNIQYARAPTDYPALTTYVGVTGARCSSVVIAFAGVTKAVVCAILSVGWCI